jgi:Predicted transcriptional regulators
VLETVGQRIRKLRKTKGWTQEQFAIRVNVSAQKVSNWERDYTPPSVDDVAKIAELCDSTSDFILTGRTTPSPSGKKDKLAEGLTREEQLVLEEIRKHPKANVFFNDLASDPQGKVRKLIKMWDAILNDIENDDDEEPED